MGMSYDDFCRCTVDEFEAVADAYNTRREQDYREEWERARWIASVVVQPHVKSRINVRRAFPFPWDKPREAEMRGGESKAESKRRFERLAGRGG